MAAGTQWDWTARLRVFADDVMHLSGNRVWNGGMGPGGWAGRDMHRTRVPGELRGGSCEDGCGMGGGSAERGLDCLGMGGENSEEESESFK